jgi:hypothetical protein
MTAEPSIFEGTTLSAPLLAPAVSPQAFLLDSKPEAEPVVTPPTSAMDTGKTPVASPMLSSGPTATPPPNFFPSLRELAARSILYRGESIPIDLIPEPVVDYLQPGARPCGHCRKPYVKEWVSSVRVKSYLGHPAVARRVRFCSVPCWKAANEQLDAEETGATAPGAASPGTPTGQLPSVVSKSISQEDDINMSGLDSALPSPTTSVESFTWPQQEPLAQGMRVCKGGQTYWPVIVRQRRERTPSPSVSSSATSERQSIDTPGLIIKTGVCAEGCLGGGVCEW